MDHELDNQLKRGDDFSIERAMEHVANQEGISVSTVEKAYLGQNMKAKKAMHVENIYQISDL